MVVEDEEMAVLVVLEDVVEDVVLG